MFEDFPSLFCAFPSRMSIFVSTQLTFGSILLFLYFLNFRNGVAYILRQCHRDLGVKNLWLSSISWSYDAKSAEIHIAEDLLLQA